MEYPPWLIFIITLGFLLGSLYYLILGLTGLVLRLARRGWVSTHAQVTGVEIVPL